jgi:stress response protein YsnF
MQGSLSRLASWALDRREDDIRGWALRDMSGQKLGTVGELIVDTNTEHVSQIVLSNGKQYAAHDVWVGDHTLTLDAAPDTSLERAKAALADKASGAKEAPSDEMDRVKSTADRERNRDIDDRPVARAESVQRTPNEASSDLDLVVPIIQEVLEVGTRRVAAGGTRVASHVVTEPVSRDVLLREEAVKVERLAVSRPLTATEADKKFHDTTLEMRAKSEVPTVDKQARVVEEVVLRKQQDVREHIVRDTVRHTEANVTRLNGAKGGEQP